MKKRKINQIKLFILISLLSSILSGCSYVRSDQSVSKSAFLLDTIVTITIYHTDKDSIPYKNSSYSEELLDQVLLKCSYYESLFSRTLKGSDIYKLNHSNGKPITVSSDTAYLIQQGIYYGDLSNGLFDISIAPVNDLWDFKNGNTLPDPILLTNALSHVDYHTIQLSGNEVSLKDPDAEIDLGGIAKGYIADQLAEYMQSLGITDAIISLGGNILTVGTKPDGTAFQIGIQKPFAPQNEYLLSIPASNLSVVSSGSYERFIMKDGIRYHHILDPKTGYCANTGLSGVTISSKSSLQGDALSTTCFLLGKEAGADLIRQLSQNDPSLGALFIQDDGTYFTEGNFPVIHK